MSAQLTSEEIGLLRDSASKACTLLKALANEDRLLLLCQLTQGERNVGELETMTGVRQPTLSQQLGILREEGLVATRRAGKQVIYRVSNNDALQILHTLYGLYCQPADKSCD